MNVALFIIPTTLVGNKYCCNIITMFISTSIFNEGPVSRLAGIEAEILNACEKSAIEEQKHVDEREENVLELLEAVAECLMTDCKYRVGTVLCTAIYVSVGLFISGTLCLFQNNPSVEIGLGFSFLAVAFLTQSIALQAMVGDR
jgi:hypothetical protein